MRGFGDLYAVGNAPRIVFDAGGSAGYTGDLRKLHANTGAGGTHNMLASDSVIASGQGFAGNPQRGAPPAR